MFSETAELYDLIYRQFKDYAREARQIAALLDRVCPDAETVLDVGCGTGEHARILGAEHGFRVDGLDIEPEFVRIAERKNPEGSFFCADMTDFDLWKTYDVVLCLFSSIAYARTLDGVRRTLENFRRHLSPGGVTVVEAWFEPQQWRPRSVFLHTAESEDVKVCRMSHSSALDGISVIEFQYLIGRTEGIEHRREVHELGLFTAEEMRGAFADAGLEVAEYDPEGLSGRGLYVARAAA